MEQGTQKVEDFELGEPALVCRWRIAGGRLPLENRHLRALSRRRVAGRGVTTQLVSWAKQHIEWTLADGSVENPDGVLMIAMDEQGRAAMSVGPYAELAARDVAALAARAGESRREAGETGVAPETLWAVRDGALVWAADGDAVASGAASLVADLAKTLGVEASRDAALLGEVLAGAVPEQAFLCSDEHGVVVAADAAGDVAQRFADAYAKLLASERAGR
ncbi:hypothetical protein [Paratractidigestivibacter sp.]|uniref:hypothetical protein n=1 Tax=Paratractidigestivibacter sp. TaxID=2847316 RepID=UPI002ABD1DF6|nr:hypothetical protein [Paratractidigestivibacter sp.]